MRYIDINKDMIPYKFQTRLEGKLYEIEIHYNEEHDLFTLDLNNQSGEPIIKGEVLVYGKPLFNAYSYLPVPNVDIIPHDMGYNEGDVTWDNLSESVFLYLVGEGNG